MGARIAFVVNALTGPELTGGKGDSARVFSVLTNGSLGKCDPARSPAPLWECATQIHFLQNLEVILAGMVQTDQLVFYFSGHGVLQNGIYCLVFGHSPKQYLPFESILLMLKTHFVTRALIILDACRSGAVTEKGQKNVEAVFAPTPEQLPRGVAILSSCRSSQVSHELPDGSASVFTTLLCEGIESGLDGRPTAGGVISITDICEYINTKLTAADGARTFEQHPAYKVESGEATIWLAYNKSGDIQRAEMKLDAPVGPVKSLEELRFAYEKTAQSRWPCKGAALSDLNSERLKAFAARVAPRLVERNLTNASLAEQLGLLSAIPIDGQKTLHNAAVLCFCDVPQRCIPQARASFVTGEPSSNDFVLEHLAGPLSEQVQALVDRTTKALRTRVSFSRDGQREERIEIPIDVYREAISNAITHRDYQATGTVQVRITSEFIEVISPGSFPLGCSWDDFLTHSSVSMPVDEAIAYYLTNQLTFEGIGRGFSVFRNFIRQHGMEAITCKQGPGPTVIIRIMRPSNGGAEDDGGRVVTTHVDYERAYLEQLERYLNPRSEDVDEPYHSAAALDSLERAPEYGNRRRPLSTGSSRRSIILGAPGSGKSVLLRRICAGALRRQKSESTVPLLVSLKDFSERQPFLEYLQNQLSRITVDLPPPEYLASVLGSGRALLALDGFDEVLDRSAIRSLTDSIIGVCRRYPHCRIVLTSRDDSNIYIRRLAEEFFEVYRISPLTDAEIYAFVRSKLGARGADHLAAIISRNDEIRALCGTPLLLELLCELYEADHRLPEGELDLIDAYVRFILTREEEKDIVWSSVASGEVKLFLGALAYRMLRMGEASISEDHLLEMPRYLRDITGSERNQFSLTATMAFALRRTGLLLSESDKLSFAHAIFMEYFAAYHIAYMAKNAQDLFDAIFSEPSRGHSRIQLFAYEIWGRRSLEDRQEFMILLDKRLGRMSEEDRKTAYRLRNVSSKGGAK